MNATHETLPEKVVSQRITVGSPILPGVKERISSDVEYQEWRELLYDWMTQWRGDNAVSNLLSGGAFYNIHTLQRYISAAKSSKKSQYAMLISITKYRLGTQGTKEHPTCEELKETLQQMYDEFSEDAESGLRALEQTVARQRAAVAAVHVAEVQAATTFEVCGIRFPVVGPLRARIDALLNKTSANGHESETSKEEPKTTGGKNGSHPTTAKIEPVEKTRTTLAAALAAAMSRLPGTAEPDTNGSAGSGISRNWAFRDPAKNGGSTGPKFESRKNLPDTRKEAPPSRSVRPVTPTGPKPGSLGRQILQMFRDDPEQKNDPVVPVQAPSEGLQLTLLEGSEPIRQFTDYLDMIHWAYAQRDVVDDVVLTISATITVGAIPDETILQQVLPGMRLRTILDRLRELSSNNRSYYDIMNDIISNGRPRNFGPLRPLRTPPPVQETVIEVPPPPHPELELFATPPAPESVSPLATTRLEIPSVASPPETPPVLEAQPVPVSPPPVPTGAIPDINPPVPVPLTGIVSAQIPHFLDLDAAVAWARGAGNELFREMAVIWGSVETNNDLILEARLRTSGREGAIELLKTMRRKIAGAQNYGRVFQEVFPPPTPVLEEKEKIVSDESDDPTEKYLTVLARIQGNVAWLKRLSTICGYHTAGRHEQFVAAWKNFNESESNADMDIWEALEELKACMEALKKGESGEVVDIKSAAFEVCDSGFTTEDRTLYLQYSWEARVGTLLDEMGINKEQVGEIAALHHDRALMRERLEAIKLRVPRSLKAWPLYKERVVSEVSLLVFLETLITEDYRGDGSWKGDFTAKDLKKKLNHIKFPEVQQS